LISDRFYWTYSLLTDKMNGNIHIRSTVSSYRAWLALVCPLQPPHHTLHFVDWRVRRTQCWLWPPRLHKSTSNFNDAKNHFL
jgi:hypothetical protein